MLIKPTLVDWHSFNRWGLGYRLCDPRLHKHVHKSSDFTTVRSFGGFSLMWTPANQNSVQRYNPYKTSDRVHTCATVPLILRTGRRRSSVF